MGVGRLPKDRSGPRGHVDMGSWHRSELAAEVVSVNVRVEVEFESDRA